MKCFAFVQTSEGGVRCYYLQNWHVAVCRFVSDCVINVAELPTHSSIVWSFLLSFWLTQHLARPLWLCFSSKSLHFRYLLKTHRLLRTTAF